MHGDYASPLVLNYAIPRCRKSTSIVRERADNFACIYIALIESAVVRPLTCATPRIINEFIKVHARIEYAFVRCDAQTTRHMFSTNVRLRYIVEHWGGAVRIVHQNGCGPCQHIVRVDVFDCEVVSVCSPVTADLEPAHHQGASISRADTIARIQLIGTLELTIRSRSKTGDPP